MLIDIVEDVEDLGEGGYGDEGDAEGFEVIEATKVSSVMFAHLEDGLAFTLESDGSEEVLAADGGDCLNA